VACDCVRANDAEAARLHCHFIRFDEKGSAVLLEIAAMAAGNARLSAAMCIDAGC
jgi:hypothetical protein